MKHLLKETETRTYQRKQGEYATVILVDEIKSYQYDSEQDKAAHMQKMIKKGFTATENRFTDGKWYASFHRLTRTCVE